MLTSLYVDRVEYTSFLSALIGKFRGDNIKYEIKEGAGIKVCSITYTKRRKNINWYKIDRIVKAQRNHLLCSADLQLPAYLGYKRFKTDELNTRLCTNLSLSLVKEFGDNKALSVCLFDTEGAYTSLCERLIKYTDKLTVVTKETDVYKELSNRLIEELGAVLRISKGDKVLSKANLVIAPELITTKLNTSSDCLILTAHKPKTEQSASVLYGYTVSLYDKYYRLLPKGLDETYFASALYTINRCYDIGSLMPCLCYNDNGAHTVVSTINMMNNILSKT